MVDGMERWPPACNTRDSKAPPSQFATLSVKHLHLIIVKTMIDVQKTRKRRNAMTIVTDAMVTASTRKERKKETRMTRRQRIPNFSLLLTMRNLFTTLRKNH